ncbi:MULTISPECIES: peptide deformylase [Synergistaceae]|uniref:peptide deformylase n=1 Tax=Synergistaceae TaxID=649777 RepID=UPI003AEDE282|nr:peptide deformylase [Synergistaceae bacterium DZ-S4]
MTVRNICVYPDPILREPTEEITSFDEVLADLVEDMWETMHVSDGVGLAGPQVGMPKKIAVIEYNGEKFVLINPVIVEKEGSKTVEEGCLSFPGIYEKVDSPEKIKVRWQNEKGEYEEKEIDGFLACVFSHEIDHLNGKLLIDRVSPLKRQFLKKKIAKQAKEQ